jgi:dihydroorotate dehydrogenase electron transfer subunit
MKASLTKPAVFDRVGEVLFNVKVAKDTYRLRFQEPEIAKAILPGQFVMVRPTGRTDPLLARPYALYETIDGLDGKPQAIDIVYLVMGNGTRALSTLTKGDKVQIWGPLGNPFPAMLQPQTVEHLMLVAGGIGQTPFLAVAKEFLGQRIYGAGRETSSIKNISFVWGIRSKEYLAEIEDFERTGIDVRLASNDGSVGHPGYVTDVVEQAIQSSNPPTAIFGCGPEPMLEKLCEVAAKHDVACWVSLETKMACGYGICFSCVCPVKDDSQSGWDYHGRPRLSILVDRMASHVIIWLASAQLDSANFCSCRCQTKMRAPCQSRS